MNKIFKVHQVAASLRVCVVRDMQLLPAGLSRAVDQVWESEQKRLDNRLFNGRVFSADVVTPQLICGHWTEFRRVVAQMRRPELHPALGVRPMAVGGIISSPDGIVFGRRPQRAVYQAGEWQLPPAGSIDQTAARAEGNIDIVAMLLTELTEELGLEPNDISDARPVGLVEHAGSHVLDLGIAVRTHLSATVIQATHQTHGNAEYDSLVLVPPNALQAFLSQPDVTLQASIFLAAARHIPMKEGNYDEQRRANAS